MLHDRVISRSPVLLAAAALAGAALLTPASPASAQVTCDGLPATIVGTNGNDVIAGTNQADVIAGLGGDDVISGLGGADVICAGDGNDTVYGEAEQLLLANPFSDDRIFGEGGNDLLLGDSKVGDVALASGVAGGADTLDGGPGSDVLGGDLLTGTATTIGALVVFGDDTLTGGEGADVLYGEAQSFIAVAGVAIGGGNDTISGGAGADTAYGMVQTFSGLSTGAGFRDTIAGGEGADTIYGDAATGNEGLVPVGTLSFSDHIDGGPSALDTADAGPGVDTCVNVENATNCEL